MLSPIQVTGLIVFLTNRTEPSPSSVLIPPECRLRAPENAVLSPACADAREVVARVVGAERRLDLVAAA